MTCELQYAKTKLAKEALTCVLCSKATCFTSKERGVKPLLQALDSETDYTGASAADRVVGNGAAFLYVLLGIKELYTPVISRPALQTLQNAGIWVEYDCLTEHIRNRTGDGYCPIETAVAGETDPQAALQKIHRRLAELQSK